MGVEQMESAEVYGMQGSSVLIWAGANDGKEHVHSKWHSHYICVQMMSDVSQHSTGPLGALKCTVCRGLFLCTLSGFCALQSLETLFHKLRLLHLILPHIRCC